MSCDTVKEDAELFEKMYLDLISRCQQLCDRVILMTGTSFVQSDCLNRIDMRLEKEILARNSIVRKASEHMGCEVFDLYQVMKTKGKAFEYVDIVHFEQSAYSYIAYEMVSSISMIEESQKENLQKAIYEAFGLNKNSRVIIYGTGYVANAFFFLLKFFCPDICIAAWTVTEENGIGRKLYGIPVYEIGEIKEKDAVLIIAASGQNGIEMENAAEKVGFRKIKHYNNFELWANLAGKP